MTFAGESPWKQAHLIGQGRVEEKPGELIQQRPRVENLSSYCLFINDLIDAILPESDAVHKGRFDKLRALP